MLKRKGTGLGDFKGWQGISLALAFASGLALRVQRMATDVQSHFLDYPNFGHRFRQLWVPDRSLFISSHWAESLVSHLYGLSSTLLPSLCEAVPLFVPPVSFRWFRHHWPVMATQDQQLDAEEAVWPTGPAFTRDLQGAHQQIQQQQERVSPPAVDFPPVLPSLDEQTALKTARLWPLVDTTQPVVRGLYLLGHPMTGELWESVAARVPSILVHQQPLEHEGAPGPETCTSSLGRDMLQHRVLSRIGAKAISSYPLAYLNLDKRTSLKTAKLWESGSAFAQSILGHQQPLEHVGAPGIVPSTPSLGRAMLQHPLLARTSAKSVSSYISRMLRAPSLALVLEKSPFLVHQDIASQISSSLEANFAVGHAPRKITRAVMPTSLMGKRGISELMVPQERGQDQPVTGSESFAARPFDWPWINLTHFVRRLGAFERAGWSELSGLLGTRADAAFTAGDSPEMMGTEIYNRVISPHTLVRTDINPRWDIHSTPWPNLPWQEPVRLMSKTPLFKIAQTIPETSGLQPRQLGQRIFDTSVFRTIPNREAGLLSQAQDIGVDRPFEVKEDKSLGPAIATMHEAERFAQQIIRNNRLDEAPTIENDLERVRREGLAQPKQFALSAWPIEEPKVAGMPLGLNAFPAMKQHLSPFDFIVPGHRPYQAHDVVNSLFQPDAATGDRNVAARAEPVLTALGGGNSYSGGRTAKLALAPVGRPVGNTGSTVGTAEPVSEKAMGAERKTEDSIEQDLDRLARDVYIIIRRRLAREKERSLAVR